VGVVLVLGLVISYFFQFLSFFRLKSSKGMSSFSLGLALLSSMLTFTNFLILHWTTVICCACVDYGRCMTANLTPLQLFANVLSLLFVYSAFLWYYPLEPFSIYRLQRKREYLRAQIILGLVILIALIFSATSATLYYGLNLSAKTLATFGRAIGILSAIVVVVQWTPQIFTTFQLGSAGSLSVVMLLIQLPGCLLTVFFQAVIGGADITTWGPYLVSAINTMILIVMCGVFWLRNRNGVQEDNFDILLSEDEHHVFEYDKDIGTLARKSYGSFSKIPPPSSHATPSTVSSTPHSGKLAWSLSDRNGFKGKLSAATFITSGTSKRTRAHLSGKDLLGTSKPPNDFSGLDNDLDHAMFASGWDDPQAVAQPPPKNQNRRRGNSNASQRYMGASSYTSNGGLGDPASSAASPAMTPYKRQADVSSSVASTPSMTPGRSLSSVAMMAHPSMTPNQRDSAAPGSSLHSSYSMSASFSNSMGVVESLGSFAIAPPPSPYASQKSLPAFGTIEEIIESDADDISFTEDPLNNDKRSLDTPHGTMDRIRPVVGSPTSPPMISTIPLTTGTDTSEPLLIELEKDQTHSEPSISLDPPFDS
jgi:hypothetical protein